MRRKLEALLATLPALAVGCAGPRTAVANLDELYSTEPPQEAVYAEEVTDRGFFSRSGDAFHAFVSDAPREHDRRKLKDPVEFALDNLGLLESGDTAELDAFERGRAVAVVAEIGHRDPSRIVRARAWETLIGLFAEFPPSRFDFAATPVDEAALEAQIEPLIQLANAPADAAKTMVAERQGALAQGAGGLEVLRPESFPLAQKLLLLVAKCGLIAQRVHAPAALVDELAAATRTVSRQVAFLAARPEIEARRGMADLAPEPAIAAARLLFALDPPAATQELGTVFMLAPDSLVRIGWIRAVAQSGVGAAGVHPTLREPLVGDLEADDASIAWWAKQALASALRLDPMQFTNDELRARWLALGEWNRDARA